MPTNAAVTGNTSDTVTLPSTGVNLTLSNLHAQIAAELAAGLCDADGAKERYGISDAQWELMRSNPTFRAMLTEALQTWGGELNAGQRITKKSEIVLEDAIPILDSIAHSPDIHPSVRIEAIKQMESLTGRKTKEAVGGGGVGFTLQINIGDGKRGMVIEGTPVKEIPNE